MSVREKARTPPPALRRIGVEESSRGTTTMTDPSTSRPAETAGEPQPLRPVPPGDPALVDLLGAVLQLGSAPDLTAALAGVADRLRPLVPFDNLAVLLLDDVGRELSFAFAAGYPERVVEHWRFGLGQGIVGTVAESGEPILAPEVSDDPRYLPAAPGTRSEVAVALGARGRTVGVLDLGSHRPAAFDREHLRLLGLLADSLAGALESRRLYRNLQAQTKTLTVLHEITRELTSILDRQRVLDRVARHLRTLVDHDVFTVFLWNEESRRLEPWGSVIGERQVTVRALEPGEGICGTAAALRQLIRVPNVALDPRYIGCDSGVATRSEVAVPLVFEDRLIGVLDLECERYDAFRSEHEQLLTTLASSLAIALANAELYETLQNRERRLDQDLRAARKIQAQLLPRSTPWAKGLQVAAAHQVARHLGGDFYDFLRYADGRVAVAVGDVAGKATSAALYAALAVGILREVAAHGQPEPGAMLAELNRKLIDLEIERRFVALTFLVFDPASRRLKLANAGLPYPFLIRGRRLEEIELGGIPLGRLADARYPEREVELPPGASLVIASDGIGEAADRQGREFAGQRLEGTLQRLAGGTAGEIADGVLDAVRRFAGDADPSDDRTVVVLKGCEC